MYFDKFSCGCWPHSGVIGCFLGSRTVFVTCFDDFVRVSAITVLFGVRWLLEVFIAHFGDLVRLSALVSHFIRVSVSAACFGDLVQVSALLRCCFVFPCFSNSLARRFRRFYTIVGLSVVYYGGIVRVSALVRHTPTISYGCRPHFGVVGCFLGSRTVFAKYFYSFERVSAITA